MDQFDKVESYDEGEEDYQIRYARDVLDYHLQEICIEAVGIEEWWQRREKILYDIFGYEYNEDIND